ncbi:MAG: hypothetical protein M2R45_02022 [Verrucomicrobia subdivision 3 bacterium]|nr:hypothetical protein [Limisphaerales bacterium]MCS1414841.1 hypothetical protein [Limisphaerales bacterium]
MRLPSPCRLPVSAKQQSVRWISTSLGHSNLHPGESHLQKQGTQQPGDSALNSNDHAQTAAFQIEGSPPALTLTQLHRGGPDPLVTSNT